VDQFIQEYQLDSPNVTKIYGNDDFRINAFVTSFKECKTRMVKLVKACQWTDRNTGEAIHKVTKQNIMLEEQLCRYRYRGVHN
jgi:hypothetical protein